MPSISELKTQFPNLAGYSDPEVIDIYAQNFGIDRATASSDLGIKVNKGLMGDIGTSLKRGVEQVPGMITGVADLPFAMAGGWRPFSATADYLGEKTGFRPGQWAKDAELQYSQGHRDEAANVEKAWSHIKDAGLLDQVKELFTNPEIAKAYATNPAYTLSQVMESLPGMAVGGLGSRALMGVGRIAGVAAEAGGVGAGRAGTLERLVGEKWATPVAAGAGEGAVTTGQQMDQYTGPDQQRNAWAALAAGVGTGGIGVVAGRAAHAMGLETAETAMAGRLARGEPVDAMMGAEARGVVQAGRPEQGFWQKSRGRQIVGGGLNEAILQELPQSMQEQVWQNIGEGKPWHEGVIRGGVEGAMAGGLMGGAFNAGKPVNAAAAYDGIRDRLQQEQFVSPTATAPTDLLRGLDARDQFAAHEANGTYQDYAAVQQRYRQGLGEVLNEQRYERRKAEENQQPDLSLRNTIDQNVGVDSVLEGRIGRAGAQPVNEYLKDYADWAKSTMSPEAYQSWWQANTPPDKTPSLKDRLATRFGGVKDAATENQQATFAAHIAKGRLGLAEKLVAKLEKDVAANPATVNVLPETPEQALQRKANGNQAAQAQSGQTQQSQTPATTGGVNGNNSQGVHAGRVENNQAQNAPNSQTQSGPSTQGTGSAGVETAKAEVGPKPFAELAAGDKALVAAYMGYDAEGTPTPNGVGLSFRQIAKKVGGSHTAVQNKLRALGYTEDHKNAELLKQVSEQDAAPVDEVETADDTSPVLSDEVDGMTAGEDARDGNIGRGVISSIGGSQSDIGSGAGWKKLMKAGVPFNNAAWTDDALHTAMVGLAEEKGLQHPDTRGIIKEAKRREALRASAGADTTGTPQAAWEDSGIARETAWENTATGEDEHPNGLGPKQRERVKKLLAKLTSGEITRDRFNDELEQLAHDVQVLGRSYSESNNEPSGTATEATRQMAQDAHDASLEFTGLTETLAPMGGDVTISADPKNNGAELVPRSDGGYDTEISATETDPWWVQWHARHENGHRLDGGVRRRGLFSDLPDMKAAVLGKRIIAGQNARVMTELLKLARGSQFWANRFEYPLAHKEIGTPGFDAEWVQSEMFAQVFALYSDPDYHQTLKAEAPLAYAFMQGAINAAKANADIYANFRSISGTNPGIRSESGGKAESENQRSGEQGNSKLENSDQTARQSAEGPIEEVTPSAEADTPDSRMQRVLGNWKKVLDRFFAGEKVDSPLMFETTPAVLQAMGLPNLAIRVAGTHFIEDSAFNHGVKRDQLDRIPQEVATPVMVLVNKGSDGKWSLNLVTRETTSQGVLVVALQPSKFGRWGKEPVHFLATVTPRKMDALTTMIRSGQTLMVGDGMPADMKSALADAQKKFGRTAIDVKALIANGFSSAAQANRNGKIVYKSDLVKMIGEGKAMYSERGGSKVDGQNTAPTADSLPADTNPGIRTKEYATSLKDRAEEMFKQGLVRAVFGHDLVKIAVKMGLTQAEGFYNLIGKKDAIRNRMETRVENIMQKTVNLPDRATAESFLRDSTIQKKWGYSDNPTKGAVDPAFKARFDALSKQSQEVVRDVFAHGQETYEAMRAELNDEVNAEYDTRIAEAEGSNKDKWEKAKAKAQRDVAKLLPKMNGPYAPLKRFGDYVVVSKSQAYREAEGRNDTKRMDELVADPVKVHYMVEMYDNIGEANYRRNKLLAHFPNGSVEASIKQKAFANTSHLPWGDIAKVKAAINESKEANGNEKSAMQRIVLDLYLHAVAEGSARKAEIRRKGTSEAAGVRGSDDMFRAFASHGQSTAHYLASLKGNKEITAQISRMRTEAHDKGAEGRHDATVAFNEIMARYAQSLDYRPTPLVDKAMSLTSFWMLATSPAYYLTNSMQTFMFTLPVLAGRFGRGQSFGEITRAYKEVAGAVKSMKSELDIDGLKISADEKAMLRSLWNNGKLDIGINAEMGRWTRQDGHKPTVMDKVTRLTQKWMIQVETLNRVTAALAAYRLHKGDTTAKEKFAADIIDQTHGNYAGSNAPRFFHASGLTKLVTQFKKYQLIQISLLVGLANQSLKGATAEERSVGRAALGYLITQHLLMTGMAGTIPAALMMLAGAMGGDDDKDWERNARKAIADDKLADFLLHGVPAGLGLDVSKKLGISNAFSLLPFADIPKDKGSYEKALISGSGAFFGGIGSQLFDGIGKMSKGDYYKGVEALVPRGLRDAMAGYRMATDGVTSARGDTLLKPDDIGALDGVMKAVGLPTTAITSFQRQRGDIVELDKHFHEQSKAMKDKYATAYKDKDTAEMSDLREEWMKHQEAKREWAREMARQGLGNKDLIRGLKVEPLSALLKSPQQQMKRERPWQSAGAH